MIYPGTYYEKLELSGSLKRAENEDEGMSFRTRGVGDEEESREEYMLENTTFAKSVDLLQRNMAVSTLRRQVISNNIANAETPNFKRSEVSFEAELGRALASEKLDKSIGVVTNEKHIPFNRTVDYRTVGPKIALDYLTTSKNNGNNVDIEREMMQATENQMMYELMTKAVSHEFRQINIVLR